MYETDIVTELFIYLTLMLAAVCIFSLFLYYVSSFLREISESAKESLDSWRTAGENASEFYEETTSLITDEEKRERIKEETEEIIASGISNGLYRFVVLFLDYLGYKPRKNS